MKKWIAWLTAAVMSVSVLMISASGLSHTVKQGDTMWKLAVKYQIGTQEIITANPANYQSQPHLPRSGADHPRS